MTVESNHSIAPFGSGFASVCHWLNKMMRNHSTSQKQSGYWYWFHKPDKPTSKTMIGISFCITSAF